MQKKEKEEEDIQKRMEWYNKTFLNKEITLYNIDYPTIYKNILKLYEDKSNKFYISNLTQECKCSNLSECECDSELYINLINKSIEINSNCSSLMNFITEKNLKTKTFRIFYITKDDNEFPLFDIYKKHMNIYVHKKRINFFIKDMKKYNKKNIIINIDYTSGKELQ